MKHLISLAAALAIAFSATCADVATAVFTVNPPMSCANCENKIKSNLRFEKGLKSITTSLSDQTVTVTYDPAKTTEEKIAAGFTRIGYKATPAGSTASVGEKKCAGTCCKAEGEKKCCSENSK